MAQRTLPGIGLTGFWDLGFDGWKDEMDANLLALSALTQARVLGRVNVAGLPGSPTNGMIYIVLDGANANKIALRDDGTWKYLTPAAGFQVYDVGTESFIKFNGTAWVDWLDGLDLPTMPDLAEEHISYANAAGASEVIFQLPAGYINFTLEHIGLAGDANRTLRMQHSTDGVTYASSGYNQVQVTRELNSTTIGNDRTSDSNIYMNGSASGYYEPYFAQVGYLNGNMNGQFSIFPNRIELVRSAGETMGRKIEAFAAFPFSSSAARWLRLYPNAGTFAAGEIYLSGRKKIT